mgnify:CR=1 FL=1
MPYTEVRKRYRLSAKGKQTAREYSNQYYHTVVKFDAEAMAKRRVRNTQGYYKRHYGLAVKEASDLKSRGCWICRTSHGKMNIDQDHRTGAVRGVLCNPCNLMIGYIDRSEKFRAEIAKYLNPENAIAV